MDPIIESTMRDMLCRRPKNIDWITVCTIRDVLCLRPKNIDWIIVPTIMRVCAVDLGLWTGSVYPQCVFVP